MSDPKSDTPAPDKKSKPRSTRSQSRQLAMQALYQWLQAGSDAGDLILQFRQDGQLRQADAKYFGALVRGVIEQADEIEAIFTDTIDRDLAQLDPVERAILLLAVLELRDRIEIPYRVIINEAVELGKQFGAQDSHRYINGVLDKVARRLRATEIAARA